MSNRTFAFLFVFVVVQVGWFWRVVQDYDVAPFVVRVLGGVASCVLLCWWLERRLNRAARGIGSGPSEAGRG